MNFIDLTDADYDFNCEFAADACEFWQYDFSVERFDDKYSKQLSYPEIVQLRENCKRILQVTQNFQGGK